MKKLLGCLLVLALLAFGAALAEEADSILPQSAHALAEKQALSIDLNGDGTEESVSWAFTNDADNPTVRLTLSSGDSNYTFDTDICWAQQVFVLDLDGDGTQEIFLSGDVASDDYYTWCLRYNGSALYPYLFADASRGMRTNGYGAAGYGAISAVGDGVVTLSGSQDVLGTWFASRTFTMSVGDRFELNDGGLWSFNIDLEDPDMWDNRALIVKTPFEADFSQGGKGTLEVGTRLVITASNLEDSAWFMTQDGRDGTLAIEEDYERGWGFMVNGVSEDELFEYVPYAD